MKECFSPPLTRSRASKLRHSESNTLHEKRKLNELQAPSTLSKKKQKQVKKKHKENVQETNMQETNVQENDVENANMQETNPDLLDIPILSSCDFEKSDNVELEMKTLMENVQAMIEKDDEWIPIHHGIESCRRLALFHSSHCLQDATFIPSCLPLVLFGASNLRSALVRNALLCLQEWFSSFKMEMETDMDSIISILLIRSGSEKQFIAQAAHGALAAATQHANGTMLLKTLLALADNKTSEVVEAVVKYAEMVLETVLKDMTSSTSLEIVNVAIVQFSKMISSSSSNCRLGTKRCLLLIQKSIGMQVFETRVKALLVGSIQYDVIRATKKKKMEKTGGGGSSLKERMLAMKQKENTTAVA